MSLVILGAMFLIGLAADVLGRHSPLPRVTLLLLGGLLLGPAVFGVIPEPFVDQWFGGLTQVALAMVGFLIGQKLTLRSLREKGLWLIVLSLGEVLGAVLLVAGVLTLVGMPLPLAMIMAGIAAASAPAATLDVVREARAEGEFTDTLLSVVALDDAWALIAFSLLLAGAGMAQGAPSNDVLVTGLLEVFGSLALGVLIGFPMAYLTGRIRGGEPMQAEAFGFVLLAAGISELLALSAILAALAMGATVASLARHHQRPFRAIEGMEWPFMILFFILAGASLEVAGIGPVGWMILVYILARAVGKLAGIQLVGLASHYDREHRRWLGVALLPQAGVAIGMALIASQRFPHYAETILAITITATVILEIASPIFTRMALRRVGEIGQDQP